jgi:hypothetical protein
MAITSVVSLKYIKTIIGLLDKPKESYGLAELKYFIKSDNLPIQSDRNIMIKFHLLQNVNAVSYIGKFVDNYSAGNQVYGTTNGTTETYVYSEPYRYCDALGRVRKIGLTLFENAVFLPKEFPRVTTSTTFNTPLTKSLVSENFFNTGDDKDAREGYEFNVTGTLESDNEDILIYSLEGNIDSVSLITNDPATLNSETTFEDLTIVNTTYGINVSNNDYSLEIAVSIPVSAFADLENASIALWSANNNSGSAILKIILRNYEKVLVGSNYIIKFYAVASQYEQYKSN